MLVEVLNKKGVNIQDGIDNMSFGWKYMMVRTWYLRHHQGVRYDTENMHVVSQSFGRLTLFMFMDYVNNITYAAFINRDITKTMLKLKVLASPVYHVIKPEDQVFRFKTDELFKLQSPERAGYKKIQGGYRRLPKALYINPWEVMINLDDGVQVCAPIWVHVGYYKYVAICANTVFRVDVPYDDACIFRFS